MSIQKEVNLYNEINRDKHDRSADTSAIYLGMKLEAILEQLKVNDKPPMIVSDGVVDGKASGSSRRSLFRK